MTGIEAMVEFGIRSALQKAVRVLSPPGQFRMLPIDVRLDTMSNGDMFERNHSQQILKGRRTEDPRFVSFRITGRGTLFATDSTCFLSI